MVCYYGNENNYIEPDDDEMLINETNVIILIG